VVVGEGVVGAAAAANELVMVTGKMPGQVERPRRATVFVGVPHTHRETGCRCLASDHLVDTNLMRLLTRGTTSVLIPVFSVACPGSANTVHVTTNVPPGVKLRLSQVGRVTSSSEPLHVPTSLPSTVNVADQAVIQHLTTDGSEHEVAARGGDHQLGSRIARARPE